MNADRDVFDGLLTLERPSNFDCRYMTVGKDAQPLFVIDNFIQSPSRLVDFALAQGDVFPAQGGYPGLRSECPKQYSAFIREVMNCVVGPKLSIASSFTHVESYYSMVATPVERLQVRQKVPHFDRPEPNDFAVLHYLCAPEHGGTSLYRHKQTGYECVSQDRVEGYLHALSLQLDGEGKETIDGYINGDTSLFDCIASVDAVYNRAAIYRCSSLHSGNIAHDYAFDLNPTTGRFTIASFVTM